jgi:hypothetical protein
VQRTPARCPTCGAPTLKFSGIGTQRVEAIMRTLFPKARIERMDADTTTHKLAYGRILGDFTAGPSHVLPTGRSGRFFSGLRVADFMRRTSLVHYRRTNLRRAAPVVAAFAAMEQLDAHGRSVEIRNL